MPSLNLDVDHMKDASPQRLAIVVTMLALGVLAGGGLVMLLLSEASRGQGTEFLPNAAAQYNYETYATEPGNPAPGEMNIETSIAGAEKASIPGQITHTIEPWKGLAAKAPDESSSSEKKYSERVIAQLTEKGATISGQMQGEITTVDEFEYGPVTEIFPKIKADLYEVAPNRQILREYARSTRRPLPDGDAEDGPFYGLRVAEASWLAYRQLIEDIATLGPERVSAASNGEQPLSVATPYGIEGYRGRAFGFKGRLFMLREMPLRPIDTEDGKLIDKVWYGLAVRLRKRTSFDIGKHRESPWVQEVAAFSTLTIPEGLAEFALKPGQAVSHDDKLASEEITVSFNGVYLRRLLVWEPIAEIKVDERKLTDGGTELEEAIKQYETQVFAPLLVTPQVTFTKGKDYLPREDELVDIVVGSSVPFESSKSKHKDKFDEAGYYLLLDAIDDSEHPLHNTAPVTELTYRKLLRPEQREDYRAGRVEVSGLLQSAYFPLVLRPNISGHRMLYRTYVAEGDNPQQMSTELQWYVDVIEPPLEFAGNPRVKVDGYYYRSQDLIIKDKGENLNVAWPVLLAQRIERPGGSTAQGEEVGLEILWITLGSGVVIIGLLIWLGRRDRSKQDRFERESLQLVRSSMARARNRDAQSKLDDTQPKPEASDDA